ncbi:uncharacterized protein LOC133824953 [Humulus lupulus]|uniref:uncharacterized protein LOC133824953 n=1 Tax=Humulus lupulus TaxID=3486 RepID=UPI002B4015AD|nr:uncharacterized protein LOC133824953 [Humulus lupulus]
MAIEEERFRWIRNNKKKLRSNLFSGLMDAIHRGDSDCSKVGKSIILSLSHTEGPRYRVQNYQDAMAICIYTIEFQKKGLPHAHILLFLHSTLKNPSADHIDNIISVEIPDLNVDPDGYNAINKFMIHGPCGKLNSNSPCMMQDRCTKHFPKKFNDQTTIDTDGFPVYKRRNTGIHVEKKGVLLDNRYVVPYHRNLIVKFDAHINVEPTVERLPFHLPGEHTVIFEENKCVENVVCIPGIEKTKFTQWLEANKNYDDARELTYSDFPISWVWNSKEKTWTRRKNRLAIGRIYFAHPSTGERFYLRMLLNFVKGSTSYESIRTINGVTYPNFKGTCYALGLLDDDKEWIDCLTEAAIWATGK